MPTTTTPSADVDQVLADVANYARMDGSYVPPTHAERLWMRQIVRLAEEVARYRKRKDTT
jgi:hypothetical protein